MEHKRQYRELDQEIKDKISQSSKNKPKSFQHRQHISQGMTKYWQSVPSRPTSTSGDSTTYQG